MLAKLSSIVQSAGFDEMKYLFAGALKNSTIVAAGSAACAVIAAHTDNVAATDAVSRAQALMVLGAASAEVFPMMFPRNCGDELCSSVANTKCRRIRDQNTLNKRNKLFLFAAAFKQLFSENLNTRGLECQKYKSRREK